MKTSILNLVCLSLVLSFAAACGKKSSGGGGGSKHSNTLVGTVNGTAAYDAIKAWQESSADVATMGMHMYYRKDTSPNSSGTMCKESGYIAWCEEPTGCFKHTSAGINIGTVKIKNTNVLGANFKNYNGCDISNFQLYTKLGNTALVQAVQGNPAAGKFVIKGLTQQAGAIVTIYYGSFDGALAPNAYAVIHTGLPSIVNPVEVGNVVNGYKQPSEKLQDIQQALYVQ